MKAESIVETVNEKAHYRQLSDIFKSKSLWCDNICFVGDSLSSNSVRIKAKSIWILGEMGLCYCKEIAKYIDSIAGYMRASEPLLRERAVGAIGRIGRADYSLIEPYFSDILSLANDSEPSVRLNFIWASENIATTAPQSYEGHMELFAKLLHDQNNRVRMEAPEMFRVIGKRLPQLALPYLNELTELSENDPEPVVRIHSCGAIKAIRKDRNSNEIYR